jgi:hypothetical protein
VSDGERGALHVRDIDRPDLVYVCMLDRPRGELVVVTLWEEGDEPAVPKRFTDALRRPRGRGDSNPRRSAPPSDRGY